MGTCDPVVAAYKRLACAILARAVRDAKSGNGHSTEARRWLAGDPWAGDLFDYLDIPPERVARWAVGLEPLAQLALL